MPKIDAVDAELLEECLYERGFRHLSVRKYGQQLWIESLDGEERVKHARLTAKSAERWELALANHRGKMEATPYLDTMEGLVELLTTQFAWVLQPLP